VSIRGKDFFDASFFYADKTRPLFYKFIAELKEICDAAQPTPTHHFLRELIEEKRVMRWYTQNIDGLEERVGLDTSVTVKKPGSGESKSVPVVGLHGTLAKLSCTVCKSSVAYEQHEALKNGTAPDCGACKERQVQREERGQRRIKGGILRPDIVLYSEPHPQGDLIAEHLAADIARRPTMLLVIGTSLKVVGLKRMIKDIAKAVHTYSSDGLVVYLNKTGIQAKSEWKSVFDCELVGESDQWVDLFRAHGKKAAAGQKPTFAEMARKNSTPTGSKSEPTEVVTPVKPPAKAKRIDTFFKHVKSTSATALAGKAKPRPADESCRENTGVPVAENATAKRSSARLQRAL
jgi:NAD-dependent histone deacetylase SIR2